MSNPTDLIERYNFDPFLFGSKKAKPFLNFSSCHGHYHCISYIIIFFNNTLFRP